MIKTYKSSDKKNVDLINKLCHPGLVFKKLRCIIRVYEDHGFYAFETEKDTFIVKRLCVHPDWRCMGIGSLLHLDLLKLAMQHNKKRLLMIIHEESPALSWLCNCWGWVALSVKSGYFDDRDGYLMTREIIQ